MKKLKIIDPLISITWLSENLHHPELIVLDASLPKPKSKEATGEFSKTQIKNARVFDMKNSFSDQTHELPNTLPSAEAFSREAQKLGINQNSVIVVYDNLGVYSSPRAWWMFRTMGHENVAVLDGGLPAWRKANLACEPIIQMTFPRGNFKARYRSDLTSDLKQVSTAFDKSDTLILDARSEGRFTGKTPEPREGLRGGHIPNSINLPFEKVIKDGKMLPKTELKQIFENLNIKGEKLIFTCGSGVTACIIALASQQAVSNQISVYDGSWAEWGQFPDLPVNC